ncbi:MAG: N-acetylmuramoyl-L-alanine amidase [Lachnospiraceae bacterium]|nr:N-acetylmuramoyl-L-alanine amidase [Lachnospiraceae bacterium]
MISLRKRIAALVICAAMLVPTNVYAEQDVTANTVSVSDETIENTAADSNADGNQESAEDVQPAATQSVDGQVKSLSVGYQFETRTETGKDVFIQLGTEQDQLSEVVLTVEKDNTQSQITADTIIQNVVAFHLEKDMSLLQIAGLNNGEKFATDLRQIDQSSGETVADAAATDTATDAATDTEDVSLYVAENPENNEETITQAVLNMEETLPAMQNTFSLDNKEKIVVIDPGHSSISTGASKTWNGVLYREEVLTMKIARYLKSELETYKNIKVYLTRDENGNPSLYDRVKYASDLKADVLVSIHLNAAGEHESETSATGVESMVAKIGTYNTSNAQEGQTLARSILDQLVNLGFKDRGFVFRTGDSTYSDGSTADYYGIVRYGQQMNVPSIIVEHGFINNQSDFERFFSSEDGLKTLAVADAKGIASYFGISKDALATEGWNIDSNGKKYYVSNGNRLYGWQKISDHTYYFDGDGFLVTGTPVIANKKYWFDGDGIQKTGWLNFCGMTMYFNPQDNGAAITGYAAIDAKTYVFDSNGVLYTGSGTPVVDGKKYWLQNGVVTSGWLELNGMRLYFDPNNQYAAAVGTPVIEGKKYWFNGEGIQQTGWLILGSMRLYFDSAQNGASVTGFQIIDSIARIFDSNGVMCSGTGTPVIDGKKYWLKDGVSCSGWLTMGNMKLYFDPDDHNAAATGIRKIDGKTYCFDANGLMQNMPDGMFVIDGKKYLVTDGKIFTGWMQLTSDWRLYFDPSDNGAAATGFKTINDIKYYFDANGIMYKNCMPVLNGKKYYILNTGKVYTGWLQLTSEWKLYMNPDDNGAASVGFTTIGNKKYYFDTNGIMSASGMPIINNKKYMINKDGSIYQGWLQLTSAWRLYMNPDDNGAAVMGFQTIDHTKYYFDQNGIMLTGFQKIDGNQYYFEKSGSMQYSGTPIIEGKKYAFDADGKQIFGWYQIGSFKLYMNPADNGAAVTSYIQIDNVLYQFNSDGVLINSEVQYVTMKDPGNGKTYTLEPRYLTDPQVGTDITEAQFLAAVLYTEAGNQGFAGQVAVAMVILNRMESNSFPATLQFVIYAKTQFEVARDGSLTKYLTAFKNNDAATLKWLNSARSLEAAQEAMKIMNTYKNGNGNKVIEGITLPAGVTAFNYLYFMTPAAFTRLNIDPVASNSMTYNGHVFFEKWITR